MIRELTAAAHRLDHWLKVHLGRPYTAILTAGLVTSIVATARGLQHTITSTAGFVVIGTVAFQVALLINQLHEYREAIRIRRQARRQARKEGAAPPQPPAG
jgi:hypothetical protein